MLAGLLNPGRAYKKAQRTLDQYYNQGQQTLSPFIQQGQAAYEPLYGAMENLLNPEQLYNQWSQGYEMSPYAQDLMSRAQTQGLDAASSMGLLGSTPALQALQAGTTQIYNQDRSNYLNDLMDKYFKGAGLAQNLYGAGQNAASNFGQNAMNMGQQSSQLTYGQNQAGPSMLAGLLGLGVGSVMGGPMGAYLGSKMGGNWDIGR